MSESPRASKSRESAAEWSFRGLPKAYEQEWEREIEKTEQEWERWDCHVREQRKLKREADLVTELNEATVVAEREAMVAVAEQAMRAGKSRKEAGELAMKAGSLRRGLLASPSARILAYLCIFLLTVYFSLF